MSGTGSRSTRAVRWLTVALVSVVAVLTLSLRSLGPHSPGDEVTLDQALKLAAAHQVQSATFEDYDSRVLLATTGGTDAPAQSMWLAYPSAGSESSTLLSTMVNAGAQVSVDQQIGKRTLALVTEFILPLLLLATLFGIFMLLARGGASQVKDLFAFSRLGARRAQQGGITMRFADAASAHEAIIELAEVRDYLSDPLRFSAIGALAPKGVLLYGPPGCGKTLLAKALAGEAGVPFYFISGSEFVESLVGVGAARVRDLFRQAKATAPCIIFVDELDAAGRKRGAGIGGGHDEREQTLNEMLVQMDGFAPNLGVVVVGATNRPDILDPALLRPGRFDRHVCIDLPDLAGRLEILRLHARSRRVDPSVDFEPVARATPGFSGADLANVLNEAALLTVRRRGSHVMPPDLVEAVDRVISGPRRPNRAMTAEELSRLAYHEAGHVIVAHALDYPAEIRRVSIVARGRNAAHATVARADRTVMTRDELLIELAVVMAGMAAEELHAGQPSTAGEADVERATEIARSFAGRYGMSEALGRVRLLQKDAEVFLGRDYLTVHNVSTETLGRMDDAVRALVDGAEARAAALLAERRLVLDALAARLVEAETVEGAEVAAILFQASAAAPGEGSPFPEALLAATGG